MYYVILNIYQKLMHVLLLRARLFLRLNSLL